uniref:EGF-like domain-containing protein n=1 Tax=Caenorhabditis tropicalis TaxID=1561998 RepID=A0A1I7V402_9PELO
MTSSLLTLSLFLLLIPTCSSIGVVWIRMSSSDHSITRIQVVDKENSSRYGISLDIPLTPFKHKEFVLPMPTTQPYFEYSIQLLNFWNSNGPKTETRIPMIVNSPWIHRTEKLGTLIFISIRFKCLPQFYGSKCQFYCPEDEICAVDQCSKCQNNSQCEFDGKESKCNCSSEYSGEFCEKSNYLETVKFLENSVNLLLFLVIIILFFFLLLAFVSVKIVFMFTIKKADEPEAIEPINVISSLTKLQILTPEHIIFANL